MGRKGESSSGQDMMILLPVFALCALGLVFVYSASSHIAEYRLGDSYFFLRRQAVFCLLGVLVMILTRHIPYTLYARLAYPLLILSLILLILLFVPGLGRKVGGACRWLGLGLFSFQPSEVAKFALAVYLAYSMSKKGSEMGTFTKGLLPHLLVACAFILLIVLQPDLGTGVILGVWVFILLFVGGASFVQILAMGLLSVPVAVWLTYSAEYRMKRIMAFWNPWEDPLGIGFHIIHSFLAFGSGGLSGTGLGNGKQKLFYLPEPHTDFILAVMGEELGFLGIAGVVFLYGVLILGGIRIALRARDLFSSYLAFGITCFLSLQVIVNMGVVMGLLPTKGLTLPLLSYGGTSMVISMASMGVLLNVASRK